MRLGYDQPYGDLAGLGAYVEYIFKSDYTIDNANFTTLPSYSLVNLNAHYNHDLDNFYVKNIELFFDVSNVFNRTYVAGASVLANSLLTGRDTNAAGLADRRPGDGAGRRHPRRPAARFHRRRQTQVLTRSGVASFIRGDAARPSVWRSFTAAHLRHPF